jgi:hypothetical protein
LGRVENYKQSNKSIPTPTKVTFGYFDSPVRGVVASAPHQAASRLLKSSFSLFTPVRGVCSIELLYLTPPSRFAS